MVGFNPDCETEDELSSEFISAGLILEFLLMPEFSL